MPCCLLVLPKNYDKIAVQKVYEFAFSVQCVFRNNCVFLDPRRTESNLSIFAQLPQNFFMGLAEIFTSVGSLEFAYSAASASDQSLFMSLHFCSRRIASFLGIGYISIYGISSDSFKLTVCINI